MSSADPSCADPAPDPSLTSPSFTDPALTGSSLTDPASAERVSAGPSPADPVPPGPSLTDPSSAGPAQPEPLLAGVVRSDSAPAAATQAAPAPRGASARPAQWTLYSRPDCGLCDELLAELVQLLPPQDARRITIVDISQDPALERKYAIRIPVLMADGEFVCAYRLDVQRVRAYLD